MNFKKFLVEFTSKNVDDFLKAWKSITKGDPALPNGRVRYYKTTYVNLIPYRYSGKIHLEEIKAMEMGRGQGTETLKLLCKLSDRYQVPISLHAVQIRTDGPAKKKLIDYYRRFGFVSMGADDYLEREPNAPITEGVDFPIFLTQEQKEQILAHYLDWDYGFAPHESTEDRIQEYLEYAMEVPPEWDDSIEKYTTAVEAFIKSEECKEMAKRFYGKQFLDDLREGVVRTRKFVLLDFMFPWAQGEFSVRDKVVRIAVDCGTEAEATKLFKEIEKIRKSKRTWFMFDYTHAMNLFGFKNVLDDGALYHEQDRKADFLKSLTADASVASRLAPKFNDAISDKAPSGYKRITLDKFREATYSGKK